MRGKSSVILRSEATKNLLPPIERGPRSRSFATLRMTARGEMTTPPMSDLDITDSVMAELRSAADIVAGHRRAHALEEGGALLEGPLPLPQRAHALLHRGPRQGSLPLLRLRGRRRRHPLRPADGPARFPGGGRVARLALRRHDPAARMARSAGRSAGEALRSGLRRSPLLPGAAGQARQQGGAVPERAGRLSRPDARGWRLGYAPDSWDALSRALLPAYPESLLVEAGLLQPRQDGKSGSYDRFRDRLLFVLRDERGRPVGFGGRTLSTESEEPKYLNSPETPVFQKKRLLYGLSDARDAIRKRDRVVLVEGYFDHLALVAAGIEETVASMGTALTPEQAAKLRRLSPSRRRLLRRRPGGAGGHARRPVPSARPGIFLPGRAAAGRRRTRTMSCARRVPSVSPPASRRRPDYLTWLLEDADPLEPGSLGGEDAIGSRRLARDPRSHPGHDPARYEECRRSGPGDRVSRRSSSGDRIKPSPAGPATAAVQPVVRERRNRFRCYLTEGFLRRSGLSCASRAGRRAYLFDSRYFERRMAALMTSVKRVVAASGR